eukprot:TRINITY_DN2910_c0_g1_i1.p1 TRINITY_DN2910_c0_g1~~TRINITY_DN2910_c0_g1_i1.p1  ORF type:complete len:660 (+),score=-9.50 TRINITY_DN2910_c0_g1_i1:337-2316(+)
MALRASLALGLIARTTLASAVDVTQQLAANSSGLTSACSPAQSPHADLLLACSPIDGIAAAGAAMPAAAVAISSVSQVVVSLTFGAVCLATVAAACMIAVGMMLILHWAGVLKQGETEGSEPPPSTATNPYLAFRNATPTPMRARVRAVLKHVLPAAVRAMNWAGEVCERHAPWFRPVQWVLPFDTDFMMRCAVWCTGLSDFGERNFVHPLRLACKDLRENSKLSTFGYIAIWMDTQRVLQGRLQLIDCRKRHPEIEDERIRAPLVILGMPRTGTTLLYNLLSLDSRRFRVPRTWECHFPYPPPRQETFHCDPRIQQCDDSLWALDTIVPDLKKIHLMTAEGPQETFELMSFDCTTFVLPFTHFHAPNYLDWFMHADITPTYRFLRWQLKYLQWQGPKAPQWLLKSPEHIFSLRSMLKVFPDARIICTHRDPVKVVSSAHSLMRCFRTLTADPVENSTIAPLWFPHLARALDDMIELRETAAVGAESSGDESEGADGLVEGDDSGDESESGDDCSSNSSRSSSPRSESSESSVSSSNGGRRTGAGAGRKGGRGARAGGDGGVPSAAEVKAVWDSSLAVDVRFHEFVRSPLAEVKRIYAHFGEELSAVAEARMQQYLDEDRLERKAHRHVYKWEDTCLDKDMVRKRFQRYVKHFNVAQEG